MRALSKGSYELFQENLRLKEQVRQIEADLNAVKPGPIVSGVVAEAFYLAGAYACLCTVGRFIL